MAERLARLKGVPLNQSPMSEQGKGFYVRPDTRSRAAAADDLMDQIQAEVDIDRQHKAQADENMEVVRQRLEGLSGVSVSTVHTAT